MDRDKKRNNSNRMFDSLVSNALDFLQRSVIELEESPKYSLIDFCTAIELFIKARLMLEHWGLVLETLDGKKATFNNLRQGDFISVSMDNAIQRLEKMFDLSIAQDTKNVFKQIREHRNRLVHFFHPEYANKPDNTAIQKVVAELCRGLYHLNILLTKEWRDSFASYLPNLEVINLVMLQKKSFLLVKFEALSQDIKNDKAKGIVFLVCEACDCESARVAANSLIGPLFSTECLVCNNQGRVFQFQCPNCSNNVIVHSFFVPQPDRGIDDLSNFEITCNNCSTLINFEDIINKYPPFDPDESYSQLLAICGSYCLHTDKKSAVLFDNKWVCLSCWDVKEEVWECERCGHFVTGEFVGPLCLNCELEDEQDNQLPSEHIM